LAPPFAAGYGLRLAFFQGQGKIKWHGQKQALTLLAIFGFISPPFAGMNLCTLY
jgi:hypothetical protein